MIIFRTDANPHIATGHLMRCLTIAHACQSIGLPPCFVLADTVSLEMYEKLCTEQTYPVEILNSRYDTPDTELPAFMELIARKKAGSVLVDSYFVSAAYLAALKAHTRVIYMDDLNTFPQAEDTPPCPVDMLIDYGAKAAYTPQDEMAEEKPSPKRLLGPSYAPLRAEFCDVSYTVREQIENVLVTTGGTDKAGMTGQIIAEVRESLGAGVTCHVVVGAMNRYREELSQRAAIDPRIILYEDCKNMAALMQKCDLAISAAGSTLYELCAVGVPTICFVVAENQRANALGLSSRRAVVYAGNAAEVAVAEGAAFFTPHIHALAADFPRRRALSLRMKSIVDGRGAARIAAELVAASGL